MLDQKTTSDLQLHFVYLQTKRLRDKNLINLRINICKLGNQIQFGLGTYFLIFFK